MGTHRTITIMGDPVRKEYLAGGAITPGHLISLGSANTVVVHAVAAGNAAKMFALEDELQGKEIGDAYSSGNRVLCGIFRPGDEVNCILATSQTIVIGDKLTSNGNGQVKKLVVDPEDSDDRAVQEGIIGIALEAVTTTGTAARIRVEIM